MKKDYLQPLIDVAFLAPRGVICTSLAASSTNESFDDQSELDGDWVEE